MNNFNLTTLIFDKNLNFIKIKIHLEKPYTKGDLGMSKKCGGKPKVRAWQNNKTKYDKWIENIDEISNLIDNNPLLRVSIGFLLTILSVLFVIAIIGASATFIFIAFAVMTFKALIQRKKLYQE